MSTFTRKVEVTEIPQSLIMSFKLKLHLTLMLVVFCFFFFNLYKNQVQKTIPLFHFMLFQHPCVERHILCPIEAKRNKTMILLFKTLAG